MKRFTMAVCLSMICFSLLRADTITQWNFQAGEPPVGTDVPSIGSGVIGLLGGVTSTGFNSGSGSSDPIQPGSGYQTTTYPAQSTASGTAGMQFSVNTTGYQNVICKFDLRTSNTSSRWYQIQYATDGINFVSFGVPVRLERFNINDPPQEIGVGDFFSNLREVNLSSISGVNNNPNFAFRVVSVYSPVAFLQHNGNVNYAAGVAYEAGRNRPAELGTNNAYGGGTWRFDMVTVEGTPISGVAPTLVNARPYHNSFPDQVPPVPKVDGGVSLMQRGANAQQCQLLNVISSSQGINGVVLDFDNLEELDDISLQYKWSPQFVFTDAIGIWADAPSPVSTTLLAGAGDAGSDRVRISWSDGSILNRYLFIRVVFGGNTIAELYLGHLLGETTGGDGSTFSIAFGSDLIPIRAALAQNVGASSRVDIDKNSLVQVADIIAMRSNTAKQLSQITIPAN